MQDEQKSNFQKKWENYWYYYKWQTFAAVFVVIVAVVTLRQCFTRVNPDITVILATQKPVLTSTDQTDLQNYVGSLSGDLNGDGKKVADLEVLTLNTGDAQMDSAMQQKLVVEMATGDAILYITDGTTYKQIQKQGFFADLSHDLPGVKLSNVRELPLSGSTIARQSFGKELAGLDISARVEVKGNTKTNVSYQNSIRILQKLAGVVQK